jgi:hypothetical protein
MQAYLCTWRRSCRWLRYIGALHSTVLVVRLSGITRGGYNLFSRRCLPDLHPQRGYVLVT